MDAPQVPADTVSPSRLVPRPGRAAIAFLVTALAGSGGFWSILNDVLDGDSSGTDRLLLKRAYLLSQSSDGDWMTPTAKFLSLFGNWQVLIPVGLLLLYVAWRHRVAWRVPAFYALACAGSGGLILLVKHLVNRPRPELFPSLEKAPFASFPSGHALYALVAYGFLSYLAVRSTRFHPALKIACVLCCAALVALVGLSRVYLNTHYPSDVWGGWLLGLPWLSALLAGETRYRKRHPAR